MQHNSNYWEERTLPPAASKLYVWDFQRRTENGAKISQVNEITRGAAFAFEQRVAASQPLADANGAGFTAGTTESMEAANPVPFDASEGIYIADLIYLDETSTGAMGYFIQVCNSAASGWPERFSYGVHYGDQIIFRGSSTDAGRPPSRGVTASAVRKGVWHLIEMQWDLNSNVTIWIDQVAVALSTNAPGNDTALQGGRSSGTIIGGSFHGIRKATAIFDGVIPIGVKTSISDYLMSVKP